MARTAPRLWLDGEVVDSARAQIGAMGQALQRGSLVFDVGSFHPFRDAKALFRAREHVRRFLRSAASVGIAVTFDEEVLVRAAASVVNACDAREGLVRWSAFFTADEPDLLPRSSQATVIVAAQIYEDAPRTTPMRIAIFEDARKAAPEALSPLVKVAAAYLGPSMAKRRAIASGAEEIVLLDAHGDIAEAPTANVFAVVDGVLVTPPIGTVLDGITRDAVLAIARRDGIAAREATISRDAFAKADEAFLTATSFPIMPIGSVNGAPLGSAPGPVTTRLSDALARAIRGEDESDTCAGWHQPI